jgi:hypothetical protein
VVKAVKNTLLFVERQGDALYHRPALDAAAAEGAEPAVGKGTS